jgi:LDH2 family malate/lactate/ureidoglycolate dehydrogenase
MRVVEARRLREVGQSIFVAAGVPADVARRVVESLVDANLVGHDSHGVLRIPQYLEDLRAGYIVADARPRVVRETAASALVDGAWAFGQISASLAAEQAIARGKAAGIAAVGLVRTSHIGRLGEWASRAASHGVVMLVAAGGFGGRGAAPYGGRAVAFGTNPLALAFPAAAASGEGDLGGEGAERRGDDPLVLVDFATTAVAAGKIRVARAKGEPLPPGSLVDRDGNPTTDPEAFYTGGMLLPFGGHKGYGLAVAVELLGQALVGSEAHAEPERGGPVYGRSGALFVAIAADLFRPFEEYARSAEAFAEKVRSVPPAPGFAEVLLPGDPERRTRETRLAQGIPLPDATWESLVEAGRALGVGVE